MPPYINPQFQQQQGALTMQHQQMMGMSGAGNQDYVDDVNDDAYDIDEAELLNDVNDQYDLNLDNINEIVKSGSGSSVNKKHRKHRHHHSRDRDSDVDVQRKRSSDKKASSRSKKRQSKHKSRSKRKHSSDSNFSDDDESKNINILKKFSW